MYTLPAHLVHLQCHREVSEFYSPLGLVAENNKNCLVHVCAIYSTPKQTSQRIMLGDDERTCH